MDDGAFREGEALKSDGDVISGNECEDIKGDDWDANRAEEEEEKDDDDDDDDDDDVVIGRGEVVVVAVIAAVVAIELDLDVESTFVVEVVLMLDFPVAPDKKRSFQRVCA